MTRTRYVYRNGKLVPKASTVHSYNVLRDIEPFTTQDGVHISSRSQLREYEQANGVKQVGNDWSGPERPPFWDRMKRRD